MRVRFAILLWAAFLALPCFARDKSDVIIMTNGDRLTCEIKGLSQGVLYVGLDYIDGTSSVQWSKVAHLESKQLFIVKTEDGSVFTGTLATAETSGKRPLELQIKESPESSVALDTEQIVKMGETSADFWQRFNGQVNFGINYAKGNDSTQYNLTSSTAYVRERWSAQTNVSSNLASSTGATTSTRNDLGISSQRLLAKKNYFYIGGADFLQSSEQGINLQTSVYGGLGRYVRNTNRTVISLIGGLAWQRIAYDQTVAVQGDQNLIAAVVAATVNVFRFNKTNLDVTASVFPALSDPGRVRTNANATYYVKLFSNLTWNASFYGNWDNHPPPNFSSADFGFSSGLGWTFGLSGIR